MRISGWIGRAGTALVTVVLVGLPLAVSAQQPQSEFVPADTLPQETLPATPLVFAAYAFVWLALVVYVFGLWRRLGRVERELADIRGKLGRPRA